MNHTLQLAIQSQPFPPGGVEISLECTCRRIFARGLFVVDDPAHRAAILCEGHGPSRRHLEEEAAALARPEKPAAPSPHGLA